MSETIQAMIVDAATAHGDGLLIGRGGYGADPARAREIYLAAAASGSGPAHMRLAMMAAIGVMQAADWNAALDHLAEAAELGLTRARGQIDVLAETSFCTTGADSGGWRKARAALDLDLLLKPPVVRPIFKSPRILAFDGIASPAMCRWIIAVGAAQLARNLV